MESRPISSEAPGRKRATPPLGETEMPGDTENNKIKHESESESESESKSESEVYLESSIQKPSRQPAFRCMYITLGVCACVFGKRKKEKGKACICQHKIIKDHNMSTNRQARRLAGQQAEGAEKTSTRTTHERRKVASVCQL